MIIKIIDSSTSDIVFTGNTGWSIKLYDLIKLKGKLWEVIGSNKKDTVFVFPFDPIFNSLFPSS